ncbi:MAG: hypothetical protein K2K57_04960 [Oscillospiraceae bacterium]|nr:hypothetical protein [Oscillospiraceae bacterium]
MKFSKIIASLAAAAVAASAMAFSAFAADPVTVTLDENYLGDWKASSGIAREEFDKFEGDVKVVLTVKPENVKDGNSYILKPMDIDKSWDAITASLTTEKGVCKPDGFIQVKADQTEVEFVVPASVKNDLWNTGLAFQCSNVTVKSATLSDGSAENEWTYVSDADTPDYCAGRFDPFAAPAEPEETEAEPEETEAEVTEAEATEAEDDELVEDDADVDVDFDDVVEAAEPEVVEAAEPAPEVQPVAETAAAVVETAPAADTTATAPVKTGNVAAVSIAFVMVAAGAAAVVSKRK